MIGDIVKVTVDRPLGSYHPKHRDIYYPINYGYVKGVLAPDGEEQDAYILGVNQAIDEFIGKIIAIIHRINDIEDKWVVYPVDCTFTKEEILEQVFFQEKYFQTEIIIYILIFPITFFYCKNPRLLTRCEQAGQFYAVIGILPVSSIFTNGHYTTVLPFTSA